MNEEHNIRNASSIEISPLSPAIKYRRRSRALFEI